jgi:metal-sulfur cluster biosynthetic enzyme
MPPGFNLFRRLADTRMGRRLAHEDPPPAVPDPVAVNPADARVLTALRRVLDPELGLDIVSLGLVHAIDRQGDRLRVEMLVTTPACPLGEQIQRQAARELRNDLPELTDIQVILRRDLPWHSQRMDAAARRQMGW